MDKNKNHTVFIFIERDYSEISTWVLSHRIQDLAEQEETFEMANHLNQSLHFRGEEVKALRGKDLPTSHKLPVALGNQPNCKEYSWAEGLYF